jgi:hypothetical protein
MIIPARERPDVEGATVGPKERERRHAKQRIDRSHRGVVVVVVRHRRPPPWTIGEDAVLVLSLAFSFAATALAAVMFSL